MFLPIVRERRSIRKFLDRKVEAEKVEVLMEAALRAFSSKGSNPWEFVVVTDKSALERLSKAKPHGSAFLKNAPLGIVVCVDPSKSTVWIEDATIASAFIHLAAQSIGLGSCWIQIRDRMHDETKTSGSYVAETLGIPGNLKVLSIIAVGYADEKKPPRPKETLQFEKVHQGVYGQRYRF